MLAEFSSTSSVSQSALVAPTARTAGCSSGLEVGFLMSKKYGMLSFLSLTCIKKLKNPGMLSFTSVHWVC